MSASIEDLKAVLTATQADPASHTKRQIIEAAEVMFDLSPADGRLNKADLVDLLVSKVEELETEGDELPTRTSELEKELEEKGGPLEDALGNPVATPVATAAKPPVLKGRMPNQASSLVTVVGKETGRYRVASVWCKIRKGAECRVPEFAVDFLRERNLII